jgi:hypothetical protein
MKVTLNQCIELLGALRALDGMQTSEGFVSYKFDISTVDKIVHNMLLLRKVIQDFDDWKSALIKQVSGQDKFDEKHPRWAEVVQCVQDKLSKDKLDLDLKTIAKSELHRDKNYIPPSVLERLHVLFLIDE